MSAYTDTTQTAKNEAERFLIRVSAWEKVQGRWGGPNNDRYPNNAPKESGAVKRASMDLTRALADIRRRQ